MSLQCGADGFFVVNDSEEQIRFGHKRESKKSRRSAQVDLRLLYLGILYFRLACLRKFWGGRNFMRTNVISFLVHRLLLLLS